MALSIKNKLLANGILAIALTLVVGVAGYTGIFRVDHSMDQIVDEAKALRHQMAADMMHDTLRSDVYGALFDGVQGRYDGRDKKIATAREHAAQLTKSLAAAGETSSAEVKAMIAKIKPELERYGSTSAELVQLALSDFPRAQEKVPAFVALFEKLETEMEQISDRIEKTVELSQKSGDQVVDVAKLIIVLVCLFAAVALIAISVMLARGILLPLDRALEAANAVAAGDLTVTIDVKGQDEVGQLLAALSKMKDDLA
ncbi:MAG: methyl-accepting chemotaxis protein, partial [Betaproteobacteria bacterium]|nr:methyl-accepting chemotaxis protein [Betaproteobacteria bacterium]